MDPTKKAIRETIAMEILKARIHHEGIADDMEFVRCQVNDAFIYADEFLKRSELGKTEDFEWEGEE